MGNGRKEVASNGRGKFFFCASPIGNLGDITLRVIDCLKEVDYIAVENEGRSRKLLSHYSIHAPLLSYREEGRDKKEQLIIQYLQEGKSIALLSDAGMPAVSDPGSSLSRRLAENRIPFTVLPGPSAATTALLLSGYPARRFVFWGFLSRRKGERRSEIEDISRERKTVIIFEAPHRLLKTLEEMSSVMPERELAVCRELTKQFEEVQRGYAPDLWQHYEQVKPRGEITIVVAPLVGKGDNKEAQITPVQPDEQVKKMLREELEQGAPPSLAVKRVARSCSMKRRTVYNLLLEIKNS